MTEAPSNLGGDRPAGAVANPSVRDLGVALVSVAAVVTPARQRSTEVSRDYGHVYQVDQQARETRVFCRIHARRITLDAIHA